MFLLGSPGIDRIRQILEDNSRAPFSYPETGATRTLLPPDYLVQREQFHLGEGSQVFYRAKGAVQRWQMFDVDWLRLYYPGTPTAGSAFIVLVGILGIRVVNVYRIVYVIDEPRRYGFAFGTVSPNLRAGEQRFLVEWRADNSVCYEVLAFFIERQFLARLAYPIARKLQQKFRNDSGLAMQRTSVVAASGALLPGNALTRL